MPSQEDETTFTLSLGGVEFCLAPTIIPSDDVDDDDNAARHDGVMSVSKIRADEVLINLNNFVGTLRVVKRNGKQPEVVASSGDGALFPTTATESLVGKDCNFGDNDHNDDNDDDMSVTEEASSLLSTKNDERSDAAPPVAPVAVPNPVEDTPSPPPKEEHESAVDEEEDEPAVVAEKNNRPKRRKPGQQKLNFFGRQHGKEKDQKKKTQKPSSTVSKRGPADKKLSDSSTSKKKPRKNNKAEERESTTDMTADFNDIIEEPKSEPKYDNDFNDFTLASMGQTMLSQDNESLSKDNNGGALSLDSKMDDASNNAYERNNASMMSMDDKFEASYSSSANVVKKASKGTTLTVPRPRWGHTQTMIDHRRFIVYGGQTIEKDGAAPTPLADLFTYDLMDGTWTRPMNCDGVARTWHTSDFLHERNLLLTFGGEVLDERTGKLTTTDKVMALDCDIMLWYPPTVSGQGPGCRSGHASCVLSCTNELVVFGGVKNGKWLNSVSILDTNRWRWSALKALGDAPRPRSYHSATAIGSDRASAATNRVVIFGGNDGTKCFNGVHVLEATTTTGGGDGGNKRKWVWSNPKCKGKAPSPRTGHDATLLNDGSTILIYGGWDPNMEDEKGDDLIFADSFLLDTKTWTWSEGPKPRYEASKNKASTNGGPHRVGHSAVLAPGSDGVQVLAFGGRLPENEFAGDFQSLVVPLC